MGTPGVELHPEFDTTFIEAVFDKGEYAAAYSGFEGRVIGGHGADGTTLADWLRERGVDTVDVVGIATDHCVRATALDSAGLGLHTTVRLELTAGVSPATVTRAMAELRRAGVTLAEAPTTSA